MTGARRTKGDGSIEDLGGGRYKLRVGIGRDPVTGKQRYKRKNVSAKNITEARKLLKAMVAEVEPEIGTTNITVARLLEEWMAHITQLGRAPKTLVDCRRIINKNIVPTLGHVILTDLSARQIDHWMASTSELRPATRRRYFAVLSAALNQAVRWGWLDISPASRATPPALESVELQVPTRDEVVALIDGMGDPVWSMALRLAVLTGCRRGEVCGLRWSDLEGGMIHVQRSIFRSAGQTWIKSTKSGRSRRIYIDESTGALLQDWSAWLQRRAELCGVEVDRDGYVLSILPDLSEPLNPDTLTNNVTKAAKRIGKPHLHMHSLRHFAATEMLAAGVDIRQVADTLGHADGGTLALQVYTHPTSDRQRAAAAAMAAALMP